MTALGKYILLILLLLIVAGRASADVFNAESTLRETPAGELFYVNLGSSVLNGALLLSEKKVPLLGAVGVASGAISIVYAVGRIISEDDPQTVGSYLWLVGGTGVLSSVLGWRAIRSTSEATNEQASSVSLGIWRGMQGERGILAEVKF